MKLVTLGGLELEGSSFQRPKPLLLLVYLSLEGRQTREHLAELFWQHREKNFTSRQLRNHLSKALSTLRKHVPDSFSSDRTSVWSLISTDVAMFRQALALKDYTCATETYKGPFLRGHSSGWGVELEEWLYEQRERSAERAQEAFLELAEQATRRQQPEKALHHARAAFRLAEPQADMLARFYILFKEQDSSLTREIQDLARGYGIALQNSRGIEKLKEPNRTPHNLPHKGTSFVGRDIELGEVIHQLSQSDCRLLSLVGMGGVGKSRLALQAAYELLDKELLDGIYYVGLDALNSQRLILTSIADALGLSLDSRENELDQFSNLIATKNILIILDNFEHLMDGATLLPQILQNCTNLKLLVTSRERLDLKEEWVFPLEGLALPGENISAKEAPYFDAIQLFVQRAYQANLNFDLKPKDLPHVIRLCHLVAGSPLALELAAVWVKMMTPETLVNEIKHNLDVLNTNTRNRSERHRNLRAVFEHSWNLLTKQEQNSLKKLSVFRGGFDREAAFEVTGTTLGVLAALVNKSLLRILPSKRYDRHPLLYQYTQEKLANREAERRQLEEKHFAYFLAFAEKARPLLSGPEQGRWLERLEQDHDNFRAALTYALTRNSLEEALNLAGNLCRFWSIRGHYTEGRQWLDSALAQSASSPTRARAYALRNAGWLAMQQGDYEVASNYATESLTIYREIKRVQDHAPSSHYSDSVTLMYPEGTLTLEDKRGMAVSLNNLGNVAFDQGDIEKALPLYTESLTISQEIANPKNIAFSLIQLGMIEAEMSNYGSARNLIDQGLAISKDLEHKQFIAYALGCRGDLSRKQRDYNETYISYQQSLLLWQDLGNQNGIAQILDGFAHLATNEKEWERAAFLLGAADSLRKAIRISRTPAKQIEFEKVYSRLETQLSEDVLNSAKEEGRNMTLEQAITYALEQVPIKPPG